MNARWLLVSLLLFGILPACYALIGADQVIQLDTTCEFANPAKDNYIRFVALPCLTDFEKIRDPDGPWEFWVFTSAIDVTGLKIANYHMNRLGIQIGNITYCANFTLVNGGCDSNATDGSYGRTVATEWADKGDFFITASGSDIGLPALKSLHLAGQPITFNAISAATVNWRCREDFMAAGRQPECAQAGDKRFPNAFTLDTPAENMMNPTVTLAKLSGAQTAYVWNENGSFALAVRDGVTHQLEYYGIRILRDNLLPFFPSLDQLDALVADMKTLDADVTVAAVSSSICKPYFAALRKANYLPKGHVAANCVSQPTASSDFPDGLYSLDKISFDPRMTGQAWTDDFWYPPTSSKSSSALIWDDISIRFNNSQPYWAIPLVAGVGWVLHRVIQRAGSIDPTLVRIQLLQMNEPSFFGQISFSTHGQNFAKETIILQADQNYDRQIVYPLGSATANYIYPEPTFDERIFTPEYISETSEIVLAPIVGFLIVISIILIVFTLVNRHHPFILAASPLFLCTILVGSIMLYSSFFMWVLTAYNTAMCHLRFWLLGIGFITLFGALFAKTWRVMRIFTTSNLTVFHITNLQLILILAILVGTEAVLLAIWSGLSNPKSIIKVNDSLRPAKNQLVCSKGKSSNVMLGILVAYNLMVVLYGIYMTIRIWRIPMKQYNESRAIAFSMYNILCFGILAFGLQVSGTIADPIMFIVRSVCLILSTFLTVLAIFAPKVFQVATRHHSSGIGSQATTATATQTTQRGLNGTTFSRSGSGSGGIASLSTASSTPPPADYDDLAEKYRQLEQSLEKLKIKHKKLRSKLSEQGSQETESSETLSKGGEATV